MLSPKLLDDLSAASASVDHSGRWPAAQLDWLAGNCELGWVIPPEYGGLGLSSLEQLTRYIDLAEACLVTAFIMTQRNGACQRIAAGSPELAAELLPDLVLGKSFATVGISHLTTSRQHLGRPAVFADEVCGGFQLSGIVPWVTGAAFAQHVVTGATLADGRQILAALPMDSAGIRVPDPANMLSMSASWTASVELDDVHVSPRHVIAGPVENVMQQGLGGGTGSLVTSALAVGLARRCVKLLDMEAQQRSDLVETAHAFRDEVENVRAMLLAPQPLAADVRQRANSLALRCSQACLTVSKGAGFVSGHPAERAVREAMFFLVWSCPQAVIAATLSELACT